MNFISQSSLLVASAMTAAGCQDAKPVTELARAAHRGDVRAVRQLATTNATADAATIALHWAARGGHADGPHYCTGDSDLHLRVVDALIDAGARVNEPERHAGGSARSAGWTPLHTAVHHKQWAIARLLIEHGADPSAPSDRGVTPLQMASLIHAETELEKKGTR